MLLHHNKYRRVYLLKYIGILLLVKEFVGEKRSIEYKQEFHDVLQK